jgi:transcriptional regulator with XRE-family HTH domain
MVTGIPGLVMTVNYEAPEELRAILKETLIDLRPQLVQRKLAFSDYDVSIVGDRVRRLRESQGLTREDIVTRSSLRSLISLEAITRLEESTDRDANPSLLLLREIATILRTTVADLIEPDFDQIILATLSTWVSDHQAARFSDISTRDRNKLLRRILLRLIDSLEKDE